MAFLTSHDIINSGYRFLLKGDSMHYKLILLDIDDTLIDFHKCEKEALFKLFSIFSIPHTQENFSLFNRENKSVWSLFEKGKLKQAEINNERFSRFLKAIQPGNQTSFKGIAETYLELLSQEHHLLEGADSFVKTLSEHYILAVLTNGFTKVQNKRLEGSGLGPLFEKIFISEEIGHSKPSKEVFNHVLKTFPHLEKNKILMIGDSLGSDILGANQSRIDSCWFNPKNALNHSRANPTFTANSYNDIIKWLFKKNALQG